MIRISVVAVLALATIAAAPAPRTHVVKPGESLSTIALLELGSAARWKELANLNRDRLPDPNQLKVGMKLIVPPAPKKVPTAAPAPVSQPAKVPSPSSQPAEAPKAPTPAPAIPTPAPVTVSAPAPPETPLPNSMTKEPAPSPVAEEDLEHAPVIRPAKPEEKLAVPQPTPEPEAVRESPPAAIPDDIQIEAAAPSTIEPAQPEPAAPANPEPTPTEAAPVTAANPLLTFSYNPDVIKIDKSNKTVTTSESPTVEVKPQEQKRANLTSVKAEVGEDPAQEVERARALLANARNRTPSSPSAPADAAPAQTAAKTALAPSPSPATVSKKDPPSPATEPKRAPATPDVSAPLPPSVPAPDKWRAERFILRSADKSHASIGEALERMMNDHAQKSGALAPTFRDARFTLAGEYWVTGDALIVRASIHKGWSIMKSLQWKTSLSDLESGTLHRSMTADIDRALEALSAAK